jgi:molybdopterin synthase sulfur carrier subunit
MSAIVSIPTALSHHTNGVRQLSVNGENLNAVIEEIESSHPGVKEALIDDHGALRRFVIVFIDGVDVRTCQGLETHVGPQSEILIIRAIAGG